MGLFLVYAEASEVHVWCFLLLFAVVWMVGLGVPAMVIGLKQWGNHCLPIASDMAYPEWLFVYGLAVILANSLAVSSFFGGREGHSSWTEICNYRTFFGCPLYLFRPVSCLLVGNRNLSLEESCIGALPATPRRKCSLCRRAR